MDDMEPVLGRDMILSKNVYLYFRLLWRIYFLNVICLNPCLGYGTQAKVLLETYPDIGPAWFKNGNITASVSWLLYFRGYFLFWQCFWG